MYVHLQMLAVYRRPTVCKTVSRERPAKKYKVSKKENGVEEGNG